MRIDKSMNLIVPIYGDEVAKTDSEGKPVMKDGRPVKEAPVIAYVHSTPLPEEQVEQHFLLLGQTSNAIFRQGLGDTAGPRFAMMMLKRLAENTRQWTNEDGTPGPGQMLIEEIRRLTMIAAPRQGGGWEPVPLQVAVDRKVISAEDRREVENVIVFFIVVSAALPKKDRDEMIDGLCGLFGVRTSSLNSTAFTTSLTTSTATGSSGATSPARASADSGSANAVVDGKPASVPS